MLFQLTPIENVGLSAFAVVLLYIVWERRHVRGHYRKPKRNDK